MESSSDFTCNLILYEHICATRVVTLDPEELGSMAKNNLTKITSLGKSYINFYIII